MDLTTLATPAYFGTMAIEHRRLARRAAATGPSPADYTRPDTLASLTMGVVSLVTPMLTKRLVRGLSAQRGRRGKQLLAATAAAALATTIADRVVRRSGRSDGPATEPRELRATERQRRSGYTRPAWPGNADSKVRWARRVAATGGVATVAGTGLLATAATTHLTSPTRLWRLHGERRDLGQGALAWSAALVGWDFLYYWNHRFMHEVRVLWAHHVVHHSSERFNLSTALRQPVSPVVASVPYGLLSWLGVRPALVEHAHGVNLLYQYWVHTDLIRSLGRGEETLNSPSHHRVHHGSNQRYIDRNHAGILIVWDRLFKTFAREDPAEPVVYGLTRNIGTFNPLRIATHEYGDIVRDVARSVTWRDRVSFALRGPGWAYRRRSELDRSRTGRDQVDHLGAGQVPASPESLSPTADAADPVLAASR